MPGDLVSAHELNRALGRIVDRWKDVVFREVVAVSVRRGKAARGNISGVKSICQGE